MYVPRKPVIEFKKPAAFFPEGRPIKDDSPEESLKSFSVMGVWSITKLFIFSILGLIVSMIAGQSFTRFFTCIDNRAKNPIDIRNKMNVLIIEAAVLFMNVRSIFRLNGNTSKANIIATVNGAKNDFALERPKKIK